MTDFLDQEYRVGDLVMYAAHSGRCINMVLGRVTEITRGPKYGNAGYDRELTEDETEVRVKIQPIKASRWKQHGGRTISVTENIVKWNGEI